MPDNEPVVGEIWRIGASLGVVCSVSEERVLLLSQIGRNVSVSRNSFLLTWSFVRGGPEESCEYEGCTFRASVQMRNMGGWRWVCVDHIQPGVDIRFEPGSERPATLDLCPSCKNPTNHNGSGTSEIAGRFLMHWCGVCMQRWVLLVGRGTPQDGYWVIEALRDIRDAADALHLREFRCLMGSSVFNSIQRVNQETDSSPLISMVTNIPVTRSNEFGGTQVVFLAQPNPTLASDTTAHGIRPEAPAVGSIWWDKITKERVRVISRQSTREGSVSLVLLINQDQREFSLEDFNCIFENVPPTVDNNPIRMGELWSYCGKVGRVVGRNGNLITLRDEEGESTQIEEDLRRLWSRIPIKTALERILD